MPGGGLLREGLVRAVVLRPAIPQNAEGMRIEPPLSEPKAMSAAPVATATAEPLEEPPGTSVGLRGLTGVPKYSLIPDPPCANSTRFALPTSRAPAALAPAMQVASETAA